MRVKQTVLICVIACLIQACNFPTHSGNKSFENAIHQISDLPVALTNNAVAQIKHNKQHWLFSFNGLKTEKTWQDVSNQGLVYMNDQWHELAMPATVQPVLASVAVAVGDAIYLLGGYTVAEDHTEISTPYVHKLSVPELQWEVETSMPTPVDDAVALVYKDRYIYLISGWYNDNNVDLVQIYDTLEHKWSLGSRFPLPPVFGHSGGIIDNEMLVCDGVKVDYLGDKKEFKSSAECVIGVINPHHINQITWTAVPHYSGKAHYRMGATAVNNHFVFAGGSDNPYNYNGIGYNKIPSKASDQVRTYDRSSGQWELWDGLIDPTMDHRGLLYIEGVFMLLGGMNNSQEVVNSVKTFKLK